MSRGFFVTGTDTEVGKTYVSRLLLRSLREQGQQVAGMKPVASGCQRTPDGLRNEDALALMAESSLQLPYQQVNPYAFEPAIAPHIAAEQAGVRIEIANIVERYQSIAGQVDTTIVEGVGGWLVPLNDSDTVADLARALELPVVLVVGLRLGCINHALLSAEAIRAHGCTLHGWVANSVGPKMSVQQGNIDTIQRHIDAPLLGVVGWNSLPADTSIVL